MQGQIKHPLISVIVPIYKVEKYLQQCVDSIINQTYKNLEIILVDDGSPDKCGEICDEYARKDNRIIVIHKENGGLSDARNAGMEIATGEFISFVDSDDWIDETLYADLLANINTCDNIILFDLQYKDECGNILPNPNEIKADEVIKIDNSEFDKLYYLFEQSKIGYACNKLYKQEAICDIRFPYLSLREDLVFNLQVLNKARYIHFINNRGYNYRQRSSSLLHEGNLSHIYEAHNFLDIVDHIKFFNKKNTAKLSHLLICNFYLDIVFNDIIRNDNVTDDKSLYIRYLFKNNKLKRIIKYRFCRNKLEFYFCICVKLGLYKLFYAIGKSL